MENALYKRKKDADFKDLQQRIKNALYFAEMGQYDGSHHKTWVIDQMVRVLLGTEVLNTQTGRIYTAPPNKDYEEWVEEMKEFDESSGEYLYDWDEGIAP